MIYTAETEYHDRYPVATMICQSLASMVVGFECLLRVKPNYFCDTTGAAFIYPLAFWLGRSKIIAYVHYPTISTVSRLFSILSTVMIWILGYV